MTSRPGRKRESSVPARGKITKKPPLCGHSLTCGTWLEPSGESLTSQRAMQNWKLYRVMSKSQVLAGSVLCYAPILGRNEAFSSVCLNISGHVSISNNSVSPWKIKIVPLVLIVCESTAKTNSMALMKCRVH